MKALFQKYLQNNCSEEEFKSFVDNFLDSGKQEDVTPNMREHWKTIEDDGELPDMEGTLYKIHYSINSQEEKKIKKVRLIHYLTRVAAVLFIPLSIAFFYKFEGSKSEIIYQTVSTPMAAKTHFVLPDGSNVWVNSGSSISFPESFDKKKRLVKLNGEAYFDVQKSEIPFQVETNYTTVNVLGTAFNVMAYKSENPVVTLERGKVIVSSEAGNQKILKPGEQATIDSLSHLIAIRKVDTDIYSSWVDNKLIFRNESLTDVVKRLERWYNITIEIDGQYISDKKLTATIEYESITEVMDLLGITLSIKYEYVKDERKLIIKPKNV